MVLICVVDNRESCSKHMIEWKQLDTSSKSLWGQGILAKVR